MRIVLIGSVSTSLRILNKLIANEFLLSGVFGYEPDRTDNISGWVNLGETCKIKNIPYFPYKKINDEAIILQIKSLCPDIIFAVGFSQLLSEEILTIPSLGCIGFHPTALPQGRGRAPIPWMILKENQGAASFFLMGKGTDDGPVFVQEFFEIKESDDAGDVQKKIHMAIEASLDKWLPELKKGVWNPVPQDESLASYYGKRNPIDGWINWEKSALEIDRLIKATTRPYPGAFTFFKNTKIIIWKSHPENMLKITGVTGRILAISGKSHLIQTGNGLLWLDELEFHNPDDEIVSNIEVKIGEKLGYNIEYELFKLKNQNIS